MKNPSLIALILISAAWQGVRASGEEASKAFEQPIFSAAEPLEEFEGDKCLALMIIGQEFIEGRITMARFCEEGKDATAIRLRKGKLVIFFGKRSRDLLLPRKDVQRLLLLIRSSAAATALKEQFLEEMRENEREQERNWNEFQEQLCRQQKAGTA